ncbi:YigZ family protein [Wenzhouxiangella sp. AB-CW3]|uniref:IMPACT family protein n=1 Tax=Wenzhouxiangella sp. AB-CW3 TaxID=2771012 RepID=UPI00168B2804|nr:YigZ family protein [Wenzhouxiangella sp. AB-CW3]QOC23686.1 YigZ family protein [Wenzhouxiangella sp. AB-CW3]
MSRTLTGEVVHEIEVKRSRFIARAAPVANEDEARAFLERIGDPGATHNCWAFKAGDQYRFDDDGEPGGTAGMPILQAIEGQDFDRVMVVVTRYFGGTKLGTGGLARAYGASAAEALRSADSSPLVQKIRLRVSLPFDCINAAHQALETHTAEKLDETFDSNGVTLVVTLPTNHRQAFTNQLRDLTRGQARIARI